MTETNTTSTCIPSLLGKLPIEARSHYRTISAGDFGRKKSPQSGSCFLAFAYFSMQDVCLNSESSQLITFFLSFIWFPHKRSSLHYMEWPQQDNPRSPIFTRGHRFKR